MKNTDCNQTSKILRSMKCRKIFWVLGLTLLSGCLSDEYMNDSISTKVVVTPGVAIPIGNADVDVHKLVSKVSNRVEFFTDAQGRSQITIFQEEDSVKYFGLNDLYDIPPASISVPVPFGILNSGALILNDSISLSMSNGSLSEARAKLSYSISATNFPYPVALTITLKDVSSPFQNPVTIQRDLQTGTTVYIDSVLNADLLLKNNKFAVKISLAKKNVTSNSNSIGDLTISSSITNLTYVKGTLGQTALKIPEKYYDINMGIFRPSNDGIIVYDNPSLSITSVNSSPFGANSLPYLVGNNIVTGDTVILSSNPLVINKRISKIVPARDTTSYNKTNSNITNFLGISPTRLKYKGDITINPLNQISSVVEMEGSDGIYLGYSIKFPLHVTVNGLVVSDTIRFGGSDLFSKVDKATLLIQSANGFPFGAQSDLTLCDSSYNALDIIHFQLLKAAGVDAGGYVMQNLIPTNTELIVLSGSQLANFIKAKNFILKTTIFTSDYDKNQVVVIQEQNALRIQLGLLSKLNTSF